MWIRRGEVKGPEAVYRDGAPTTLIRFSALVETDAGPKESVNVIVDALTYMELKRVVSDVDETLRELLGNFIEMKMTAEEQLQQDYRLNAHDVMNLYEGRHKFRGSKK